jgi:hypothetical protein
MEQLKLAAGGCFAGFAGCIALFTQAPSTILQYSLLEKSAVLYLSGIFTAAFGMIAILGFYADIEGELEQAIIDENKKYRNTSDKL